MKAISTLKTSVTGTLAVVAWLLASAGPGTAGTITTLYNTGVDATGTPLPDGTPVDPHYALTSVPLGSTYMIMIRTSAGGFPIGPWIGDDTRSTWIGPNNQHDLSGPVGTYDYTTTFTLPTAALVRISGVWATDNQASDILFNGNSTGNSIPFSSGSGFGFQYFTPFSISGLGQAGVNTLDFEVYNSSVFAPANGDNPTGLRVEMTGTFTASTTFGATPEPASLVLLGVGIASLAGYRWRRRFSSSASRA